jgi:hypothetical protein
MQARFPGTCRDCGNKFPAGTDIHYDRRTKKASCCNGSPQVAQSDRAFIVDGAMKMEWVAEKTYMEGVAFQGDSVTYEEMVYSGYNWMCVECRLVWGKQHQGINCGKRNHVASYEDTYGVKEVRNGVPTGPNMYTITRTAIRREKSPDVPPVAPAPVMEPHGRFPVEDYTVPQVEEPAQVTGFDSRLEADKPWSQIVKEREIRECRVCTSMMANHRAYGRPPQPYDSTLCECCEEKPATQHITGCDGNHTGEHCVLDIGPYIPVDMTSEQLWDSMGPGTITTSWN